MKKTILSFVVVLTAISLCMIGCEGKGGLSTPSGFKASQVGETVVLTWNEVSGASYYEISKNGSYWQSTSETRIVDKNPKEGINSYELTASDGDKQSKPAKASCDFESSTPSGGGGGGQTSVDFYIKHPWSGGDWTWQPMTKSGNSYTYTGVWGGVGANINTSAEDNSSSEWYEKSKINGASSLSTGETVTFTFISTDGAKGTLSVTSGGSNPGGNSGGEGGSTKLPAPTGFTLSQTSSYIQLSWNRVSGAAGYYIAKATADSEWEYYQVTSTSAQFDDVIAGTTYVFSVAAYDSEENLGEWSEDKYITFNGSGSGGGGGSTTSKPSTPTGVNATAYSSYIQVTWNSVSGAESYNVYRSTSASGSYTLQSSVTTTNYTDYNVNAGTTYYYKVEAENSAGKSSKSSYVSAKIATSGGGGGSSATYEPCPPTVTCSGTSSVTIKWTASTGTGCGTPTSYDVKRSNRITGQAETLKSGTTSTSYTDSQPFPGVNLYGVTAKNSNGSATGQSISSSVGIAAPTLSGNKITGSATYVFVTVKDLNVPEEWKQYYSLELYKSSSYSGNYFIENTWSYNDFSSGINGVLDFNKYYGSTVNLSGHTYYYKVRWVFEAPHSPSRVEGSYSSVQTVKHQ